MGFNNYITSNDNNCTRTDMDTVYQNPQITTNFPDITSITGVELIDSIYASYREVGEENSIVITRSNKRANLFNQGIRNQVLQRESELANTDMVMVIKNNYFWAEKSTGSTPIPFWTLF